jgi:hypothetical protein
MAYQGSARAERGVVELREGGAGTGAVGAHAGLRADEGLHALQRGGRLFAHEVPAHQRLQLHQRLERSQRLLSLQNRFDSL